jgi:light-regulated signal transduction histidine kinase (bacteriophytochrome)
MEKGTHLRALVNAGHDLDHQATVHATLERIPELATQLLDAQQGALYLNDGSAAWPCHRSLDRGPAGESGGARLAQSLEPGTRLSHLRSGWLLHVPLKASGKLLGTLAVQRHPTSSPFSESDSDLLDAFALQAAFTLAARQSAAATAAADVGNASLDADLDTFPHRVAHDLRAPLRHILSFTERLQKHTTGVVDSIAQRHIEVIAQSARRLQRLVDGLLELTKINRVALCAQALQIDTVVAEVIAELRSHNSGRNIEWRIGNLPQVYGDRRLLKLVLTHLLDNAVKFTAQRPVAHIEVGCSNEAGSAVTLYVRDDGAGFDPAYGHQLFGLLKRLHAGREFEGPGIGLATVKRIVERHGGTVRAEGTPGAGATFYFSLPQQP